MPYGHQHYLDARRDHARYLHEQGLDDRGEDEILGPIKAAQSAAREAAMAESAARAQAAAQEPAT